MTIYVRFMENLKKRICLGAMRSSPINSILAEVGEAQIKVKRQYLVNRYLMRTFNVDYDGDSTNIIMGIMMGIMMGIQQTIGDFGQITC